MPKSISRCVKDSGRLSFPLKRKLPPSSANWAAMYVILCVCVCMDVSKCTTACVYVCVCAGVWMNASVCVCVQDLRLPVGIFPYSTSARLTQGTTRPPPLCSQLCLCSNVNTGLYYYEKLWGPFLHLAFSPRAPSCGPDHSILLPLFPPSYFPSFLFFMILSLQLLNMPRSLIACRPRSPSLKCLRCVAVKTLMPRNHSHMSGPDKWHKRSEFLTWYI